MPKFDFRLNLDFKGFRTRGHVPCHVRYLLPRLGEPWALGVVGSPTARVEGPWKAFNQQENVKKGTFPALPVT